METRWRFHVVMVVDFLTMQKADRGLHVLSSIRVFVGFLLAFGTV